MSQGVQLLIRDAGGIYIPRDFSTDFHHDKWQGVSAEDWEILADPEHERYWEAWDSVLSNATFTDDDGSIWRLYQDGDLWVYCQDKMTILEQERFGFDVDMEEFIESRGFILELQQSKGKYYYWVNSRNGDRATWAYPYSNALRDCIEENNLDTIPGKE